MTYHSPIGEALKKKKEKKTIVVCKDCGCPTVFTFAFVYNERYCLNCGKATGAMSHDEVDETLELKEMKRIIQKLWAVIYGNVGGLLPNSNFKKSNCKKCTGAKYHNEHLTKKEVVSNKIARRLLEKVKGIFEALPKTNRVKE